MSAREAANITILFPHNQLRRRRSAELMQHILRRFQTLLVVEDLQWHGIGIVGIHASGPQLKSKMSSGSV
jgi:hypothetical protein